VTEQREQVSALLDAGLSQPKAEKTGIPFATIKAWSAAAAGSVA